MARLLGHPVHPPLTAFPLVLLTLAPVADAVGWGRADPLFWQLGFWFLVGGLVSALPTAATGFLDFTTIPADTPAAKSGLWHLSVMLSAVSLSGLALALRGERVPADDARLLAFALEAAGALLMLGGGWLGGHLVFHHGVGVEEEARGATTAARSPPAAAASERARPGPPAG